MNTTEVLNRLVTVGPDIINTYVKPGPHCVLATTVGQMTLARFGIAAEPFSVEVSICNQAWIDWATAHYPGGREEQYRRGAYLLSNAPNFPGESFMTHPVAKAKAWDGHLVLKVPDGGKAWLLDLDLGSFNRPDHRILLPGGLLAPLSVGGCLSGVVSGPDSATSVAYRPMVAAYANDYQTAKDWVDRARFTEHVDELEQALRG